MQAQTSDVLAAESAARLAGVRRAVPIRVLVADDSAVMRSLLRTAIGASPQVEVAGMAQDGREALEAIGRLDPDLVLLDLEMPRMNGLEVLSEMRARRMRAKVIVCSTLTRRGAGITLEALARGAADYVPKPVAQRVSEGLNELSRELLPKVLALFPREGRGYTTDVAPRVKSPVVNQNGATEPASVLVVGVSTGGPAALEKLLPAFPRDLPLPILIAQHMPRLFTDVLAARLNAECRLSVREAQPGAQLENGVAYIARGDWHMEVTRISGAGVLRLHQGHVEEHCRPSVDLLFRSAAASYGAGVLAVVLTGMGSDGLIGCRAVRAAGGKILVQDRQTSAVWGMPGGVARAGLADQVLPVEAIAEEVTRMVMNPGRRSIARQQV
ncbi:MAG: chemotaxis-specific protein-glutamate methyltransferase CheB [Silvibacterium sp.]|nr:chemotaxis-specific protein-glutamate methyltransferase CheB [Silvibacterium sp.]